MRQVVFQTKVNQLGEQVEAFYEEGMFVLFGENVPDTLKDFCYYIDMNPVEGTIEPGQILKVNDTEFLITAVGSIAQVNLETMGHLTVIFSGAKEAGLPGSICVEAKPIPKMSEGTEITIEKAGEPQ